MMTPIKLAAEPDGFVQWLKREWQIYYAQTGRNWTRQGFREHVRKQMWQARLMCDRPCIWMTA
jgi:hypothetical protein